MILRNFDRHAEIVEYDPGTNSIRPARTTGTVEAGTFAELDGHRVCLYRSGNRLMFAADGAVHDFSRVSVELTFENGQSCLRVRGANQPVLEVRYRSQAANDPDDLTPFAELEDFDFGIFLTNLAHDKARQLRVFSGA